MRETFAGRRQHILSSDSEITYTSIITDYPALVLPYVVRIIPYIALIFRRSQISQILNLEAFTRFFQRIYINSCGSSVSLQTKFQKAAILKKFLPTKYKRYTVCFIQRGVWGSFLPSVSNFTT